ncbi:ras-related protein Rab11D-like [Dorcoceras hygrometricum]|uniref:Ras-related protein Rab11D-like n=1 Tax=Dorcoceras hygrometricum TaxID=472368 RepID=A0A2Z7BIP6_9LAMI|nr:ras-related protein Rab11D-like [Dorcoceras hygrometricum]
MMQRHTDYGFLPKTQPDLNPAVHVSPYRRSQYNIMRIMISLRIVDVTSGPDLNHTYSYNSIIRLGLAAGDTPDCPHDHLETRGPSISTKSQHAPPRSGVTRGFHMKRPDSMKPSFRRDELVGFLGEG